MSLVLSCSVEENENFENEILDANFRTAEYSKQYAPKFENGRSVNDLCYQTRLIAGQHHDAGLVSVSVSGEDLVITYQTYEGWQIDATHLSVGNCDDQSIPTTGSGNPKVGKFEHSTNNTSGTTLVSYTLDISVIDNAFCFAAHAEVSGPSGGETAWAEGTDFDGNNWAMFVEALLTGCTDETGDDEESGPVLL